MRVSLRLLPAVLLAAVLSSCGSETAEEDPAEEGSQATSGDVVFVTTGKGEVFEFGSFEVSCPDQTENEWGQDARLVYAMAGVGTEAPRSRREPMLRLTVVAEEADGTKVSLPYGEDWGRYETFITAFITEVGGATELSAGTDESSGHIEIVSASCDPTPQIDVRIDAHLVSETGDGQVTAKGHIKLG